MREVTFIEGLKARTVMAFDVVEYYKHPECRRMDIAYSEDTVLEDVSVERHIAPVFTFCDIGHRDTHIAYSEEVEKLLGVPIRILKREHEEAVAASYRDKKALLKAVCKIRWMQISKWTKLKWLLTDPTQYEFTRRTLNPSKGE